MSSVPETSLPEGSGLTHLDERGQVRMVDVSNKATTSRTAVAESWITMSLDAFAALRDGTAPKGDLLATVRVGAIMAVKATSTLIPLCHPLPLDSVACDVHLQPPDRVRIEVTVSTSGKTGVEMEALTGASVGSLVLYDMLKAIDKSMRVGPTQLLSKEGGKSGSFRRQGAV